MSVSVSGLFLFWLVSASWLFPFLGCPCFLASSISWLCPFLGCFHSWLSPPRRCLNFLVVPELKCMSKLNQLSVCMISRSYENIRGGNCASNWATMHRAQKGVSSHTNTSSHSRNNDVIYMRFQTGVPKVMMVAAASTKDTTVIMASYIHTVRMTAIRPHQ